MNFCAISGCKNSPVPGSNWCIVHANEFANSVPKISMKVAEPKPVEAHYKGSKRFHELLKELGDLHDAKQIDYGKVGDPFANVRASEEWGIRPWVGAMVRLNDKVKRLQNFARKGSLKNESAEDSMRDIAVYSIIALVLYEQETK